MLITIVPFATLALLSAAAVHPTNGQETEEAVDFHVFPELADLGFLEDLVDGAALGSDTDAMPMPMVRASKPEPPTSARCRS